LPTGADDGIVVVEMERSVMAAAPLLTTEQYLNTPETLRPTEVIFGALRVADAPTVRHQQAVGALYLSLAPHVRERRLGTVLLAPVDVILDYSRALILQPDLLFVSRARRSILNRERIMGAPDLVIEVLSPHPRIGALQERLEWFAAYGVREIWLLHQTVERMDILGVADGRIAGQQSFDYATPLRSTVLPDFNPTLDDVMRE
jgi:Uma2 family endonuclease